MSHKPTLSPSKIATYLACPVKYYWTYVDPKGRWYLQSKSYYSFGTSLHRVLQRFHDEGDRGVDTVHQALATLEESWIEAGYDSQEEMQQALGDGKALVSGYIERFQATRSTAKVLYVEKRFRLEFDNWILIGQVDRVDEHEDGSLEIIDYKSGREEVTQEDVASDLAMCCYQLLVKDQHPDREVRSTIIALRSGEHASATLSPEAAVEFRGDLEIIASEISCKEFSEMAPFRKRLCTGCDFLSLCKVHPDFGPETE